MNPEHIDHTDGPYYKSVDGHWYMVGEGPEFEAVCPFCGTENCETYPDCEEE